MHRSPKWHHYRAKQIEGSRLDSVEDKISNRRKPWSMILSEMKGRRRSSQQGVQVHSIQEMLTQNNDKWCDGSENPTNWILKNYITLEIFPKLKIILTDQKHTVFKKFIRRTDFNGFW